MGNLISAIASVIKGDRAKSNPNNPPQRNNAHNPLIGKSVFELTTKYDDAKQKLADATQKKSEAEKLSKNGLSNTQLNPSKAAALQSSLQIATELVTSAEKELETAEQELAKARTSSNNVRTSSTSVSGGRSRKIKFKLKRKKRAKSLRR